MAITVELTYDMAKALGGVRRFDVAEARTVLARLGLCPTDVVDEALSREPAMIDSVNACLP